MVFAKMSDVRRRVALIVSCACACAATASVFDDARLWWKFDNGGADGAVVQKSEIYDVRDANAGVPTALYGAQGGPYDPIAFDVNKGEMRPGWNTLNQQFLDSSGYMTFDFFQLDISDYFPGTILFVR